MDSGRTQISYEGKINHPKWGVALFDLLFLDILKVGETIELNLKNVFVNTGGYQYLDTSSTTQANAPSVPQNRKAPSQCCENEVRSGSKFRHIRVQIKKTKLSHPNIEKARLHFAPSA